MLLLKSESIRKTVERQGRLTCEAVRYVRGVCTRAHVVPHMGGQLA